MMLVDIPRYLIKFCLLTHGDWSGRSIRVKYSPPVIADIREPRVDPPYEESPGLKMISVLTECP